MSQLWYGHDAGIRVPLLDEPFEVESGGETLKPRPELGEIKGLSWFYVFLYSSE